MRCIEAKISRAVIDRNRGKDVKQITDPKYPVKFRYRAERAKGSWFVVKYQGGKAVWRKVGGYPEITPDKLFDRLPEIMIALGINADSPEVSVSSFDAVNDVIDWYVDSCLINRNLSKSRKATIKCVAKQLKIQFAFCQLGDLCPSQVDQLVINNMQETGYSTAYIRQTYDLLRLAFQKAHKLKKITVNPIAGYKFSDSVGTKIKPKPSRLHKHHLPSLFEQLKHSEIEKQMLAVIMLLTGTRIGETRMARWDHIDWGDHILIIPEENAKNGDLHRIPLTKTMVAILKRYRAVQEYDGYKGVYLFPNGRGRNISSSKASEYIRDISGSSWSAHDLRKLARSIWADLDIDYFVSERLLNHKMSNLDQTYIHSHTENRKRMALEKYHEWMRNHGLAKILQDI